MDSSNALCDQKIKKVIVLVDNRVCFSPVDKNQKQKNYDPRSSAFKQTQIDAQELCFDFNNFEESIIEQLNKRLNRLERRVQKLENWNQRDETEEYKAKLKRKIRRKASQIRRSHQCHFQQCNRCYGSETSLRNHLRLKHGYNKPVLEQNL